ncbi:MAG TPA: magnesium transporter [bacterium]|nr:magnesium transporter [bacterium]HPN43802.1 magnesium transporter [bacterium]
MDLQDRKEITENISYLLHEQDIPKLKNIIVDTHPADLADIIRDMDDDERNEMFKLLDPETASEVMLEFDDVTREDLIKDLETSRLSEIVNEMDSDDATDVIATLPEPVANTVLSQIDTEDRVEVEKLLVHEEDTAGGIMALETVTVFDDQTVDDAIQVIRQKSQEIEHVYQVYAIDREGRLVGIVPLKKLILSSPETLIRDVMQRDVISVTAEKDQEYVANLVSKYDLLTVPVVDAHNRLVGRITIDDVVDVLQEEANEDIRRMAGISSEEALQETSSFRLSRNRLPWLFIAFVGELVSAFIMSRFNASLQQIITLSFFVPVIMAMGGNSGIQASTIVVRSIAMDEGGASNRWDMLYREFRVALINGLTFATLIFAIIYFWLHQPLFGLVVSFALMFVIVFSVVVGTIIPVVLHRMKFDPAIATGPFITTSNDVFGLLIYFSMAAAYLKWLQ